MRAKFYVEKIERGDYGDGGGYEVIDASPVTIGSEENKSFSKWTPSGSLSITFNNPAVMGVYNEGDEFYLDFTRIDK